MSAFGGKADIMIAVATGSAIFTFAVMNAVDKFDGVGFVLTNSKFAAFDLDMPRRRYGSDPSVGAG